MQKEPAALRLYPTGEARPDGCVATCLAMRLTVAILRTSGADTMACQCGEVKAGRQLRLAGSPEPPAATGWFEVIMLPSEPPPPAGEGGEFEFPHPRVRV